MYVHTPPDLDNKVVEAVKTYVDVVEAEVAAGVEGAGVAVEVVEARGAVAAAGAAAVAGTGGEQSAAA